MIEKMKSAENYADASGKIFINPGGTRLTYCCFCYVSFGLDGQDKHLLDNHLEENFQCLICNKMATPTLEAAKIHLAECQKESNLDSCILEPLKSPKDPRQIKCLQCDQLFLGGDMLAKATDHLKKQHGEVSRPGIKAYLEISCKLCSTKADSLEEVKTHLCTYSPSVMS